MKLQIVLQVLLLILHSSRSEDNPRATVLTESHSPETKGTENRNEKTEREVYEDSSEGDENDRSFVEFEYDDEDFLQGSQDEIVSEQAMQEAMLKAMKMPHIKKQISEVIPILRVMSPAQRLTLASLVSSEIMSPDSSTGREASLSDIASIFAGKNLEDPKDRQNITEYLLLPISMDVAKMFRGIGKEFGRNFRRNLDKVQSGSRARNKFVRGIRKSSQDNRKPTAERRADDFDYEEPEESNKPSKEVSRAEALRQPMKEECDYFTKSLCLEVSNYPTEAIISSLKKNAHIAETFLTDFEVPSDSIRSRRKGVNRSERQERLNRRQDDKNEIQDSTSEGSMCPSSVKYARPKRARTTSGQWKYVVNAGDYTQTLRLEICLKPKSSCSFVTNHLNSECTQVYNYHRLLTWDESKGLHMDVFKVPSCCSCHIQGYSNLYPPTREFLHAENRPIEIQEIAPELQERPTISSFGNKREVAKPIPASSQKQELVQPQQPVYNSLPKERLQPQFEQYQPGPADHLIPPGPPLPLEGESYSEPDKHYYLKKGPLEYNQRLPIPIEEVRPLVRTTERPEIKNPVGSYVLKSKPQLSIPPASGSQHKPNLLHPQPPYAPILSRNPNDGKQAFDQSSHIRYVIPLSNTTQPYSNYEIKKIKATESRQRITYSKPNKNIPPQNIINTTPKRPIQYIRQDFEDISGQPSRVRPLFVTPPKPQKVEIRKPTVPPPVQTVTHSPKNQETISQSGQRKVNYNYHPIIDFFTPENMREHKRQLKYSTPQRSSLSSQDWTPVVGHH